MTRPTPAPVRPMARAAPVERSSTRPLMKGPRSLIGDDDALAAMGHPQLGAERQRAVGCGHGVLVEALTGSGLAAGFIAVEGGHSREAATGPMRADRGIGVAPVAAGGLGGVVGSGGGGGDGAWIWPKPR